MENIKDVFETKFISLVSLSFKSICTCTEMIYGCLSTEHEASNMYMHDINVVGP